MIQSFWSKMLDIYDNSAISERGGYKAAAVKSKC